MTTNSITAIVAMIKLPNTVVLYALILNAICFATVTSSLLSGKSFSVKTRSCRQDLPDRLEFLLEESYSKPQNRARIKIHTARKLVDSRLKEFHYDSYYQHGLLYSPDQKSCNRMNLSQFYESLNFYSDFVRLMQLETPNSNPVVGPARLLLFITSQASLLRNEPEQPISVYGIPVIKYYFEVPLPGEENSKIELRVYYDKVTHDPDSLENQFPVFIAYQNLWLHYFQLEINHDDQQIQQKASSLEQDEGSTDIILDEFAIPLASACINTLPKYEIYTLYDMQSLKFSFEADTLDQGKFLEHYWVQYDGLLEALRVDSYLHDTADKMRSSIFNLRRNRRYSIKNVQNERDRKLCLVMKNLGKERANLKLSNLLIGDGNLSLMGRAKVRGIDASVYGTLSDKLPYWFDQPVLYQHNGTDEALRRRGVSPYDDLTINRDSVAKKIDDKQQSETSANARDRYKILVYIDELSKENRLLALDVYDMMRQIDVNESTRILKVRFRDFAWELTEAPDGSQISDVFALADSCSARPAHDHHLELDLLLSQDEISAIADSSMKESWVRQWPLRNSAILVGLSDSIDLDSMMIYDLESRIKTTEHKLAVDVHFKLAEQAQLLHSLKLIGRANLKPTSNALKEIEIEHEGSALLLTDCLSLVAARNQFMNSLTYVYYSEQHSSCLIDPTLNGADEKDLYKSPIIYLTTRPDQVATGELYQIETYLDPSFVSTAMVKNKKNRILSLTHTTGRAVQPIDPAVFRMRIEQIKITNNHYLGENSNQLTVYKGIAFSGSEPFNRIIKLAEDNPIGLSKCQSACLADYKCRSFSFCVKYPGSECILSEISGYELSNQHLNTILLQALKQSSGNKIITIETETHGSVKLLKDIRCELHRKSYLDQFIKGEKEKNVLDGHWTIPVLSVEDCAQSCFLKTLDILKQLSGSVGLSDDKDDIRQICARFLYSNSLLNDAQKEAVKQAICAPSEFDVGSHSGGFCLIKYEVGKKLDHTKKNDSQPVFFNFDYYDFDFTSLYERTFGATLPDTSTEIERNTQSRLYHEEPRKEDYEVLERADREGRNVQSRLVGVTEQLCARKCLMQTTTLVPACRSFDVIQRNLPDSKSPYFTCYFNTRLANETGLNNHHNDSNEILITERGHFEPRWDLIKHAIELGAEDTTNHRDRHPINTNKEDYIPEKQNSLFRETSIVVGLFILAIVSGIILGTSLTKRFLLNKKSVSNVPQRLYTNNEGDIAIEKIG